MKRDLSVVASISARLHILHRLKKPRNYELLLRIFAFAFVVPWLMRLPLAWVDGFLTPTRLSGLPDQREVEQIVAYTDAVIRSCRPLVQDRCLTRGLTLYYFLRQNGLAVELQFGAGYVDQAFAAHCWLVKDGEPFAEATDPRQRFAPTYKFPTTSPVAKRHASA